MKAYYTTHLITLLENNPDAGIKSVNWRIGDKITEYKDEIIERFNMYYSLYEIGQETEERWQYAVNRVFETNRERWNHLIKLYDENVTKQIGRINSTIKARDLTRLINEEATGTRTGNMNETRLIDTTQSYKTDSEEKEYDTPVTQTTNLNDGYLSGGVGNESTTIAETDGSGTNQVEDTTTGTTNKENNKTESEDTDIQYMFQDKNVMSLIYENYNVWQDIIQVILNDCRKLFLNTIARY